MVRVLIEKNTDIVLIASENIKDHQSGYIANEGLPEACIYPFGIVGKSLDLESVPEAIKTTPVAFKYVGGEFIKNEEFKPYVPVDKRIEDLTAQLIEAQNTINFILGL